MSSSNFAHSLPLFTDKIIDTTKNSLPKVLEKIFPYGTARLNDYSLSQKINQTSSLGGPKLARFLFAG
jgi:hypothetical protein